LTPGNPEQQKAIVHGAGPMMVLAGPGSGKTFVLTRRIAHLINTHHVNPSEILVITFTKAAAGEMQQRFLSLCEGAHPPVTFGTFHAVFYAILKETSVCRAGSILSEAEKRKMLRDIIQRNKYNISTNTDLLEEILSEIGQYKNRVNPLKQQNNIEFIPQNISPELFRNLYRDFTEAQDILGKVDFDDMALKCEELFRDRPDLLKRYQERYRYLLVDEFQDIAPVQYHLVRLLAEPENNLFIVGDDDQSIYGFRGARPDIMRNFPKDYPDAKIVSLQMNYRSTPEIVASSKRLIAHNRNRFPKDARAAGEAGAPIRIEGHETENMQENALIRYLLQEKKAGKLSECAVISRTSGSFPVLAEKFRQAGIPCSFKEKVKSIFDHEIVDGLLAYLEFSAAPLKDRNRSQFFRFMNRPLRYISRDAVNETADFGYLMNYYRGRPAMQETVLRLWQDLERMRTMPVFLAVNYIRKAVGYDSYLVEKYGRKRERNNKGEPGDILEAADLIQASAKGCRTLREWKDMMEECRNGHGAGKMPFSDQSGGSGEKNAEPGVTLMTMHGSKGLEYDKVFIVNCNERITPHRKARTEEEMEEERRMFYVGMTRAKKELNLLYITGQNTPDRKSGTMNAMPPSRFLKEIQETL